MSCILLGECGDAELIEPLLVVAADMKLEDVDDEVVYRCDEFDDDDDDAHETFAVNAGLDLNGKVDKRLANVDVADAGDGEELAEAAGSGDSTIQSLLVLLPIDSLIELEDDELLRRRLKDVSSRLLPP